MGPPDTSAYSAKRVRRARLARVARVARYALAGLALSVAGVLVAAPFGEPAVNARVPFTQRSATAWTWGPGSGRQVLVQLPLDPSAPEDAGMPQGLRSALQRRPEGPYEVWWSGFPLRSVCGWHVAAGTLKGGGPPADVWHGVVRIPIAMPIGDIHVPVRPLWLGLFANTAVYAVLVYLAAGLVRRVRGDSRRERNRCTACGYALAGLGRCPECGRRAFRGFAR